MKAIIITSITFFFSIYIYGQSNFNKEAAQEWLNNKRSKSFTEDSYQKTSIVKLNFTNCNVSNYTEVSMPKYNYTFVNSFDAQLNILNPESLTIQYDKQDNTKFYLWVTTTNSENRIAYYAYNLGQPPKLLQKTNKVQIGPFDLEENNIEERVKNTFRKLIIACGGKKDMF